MQHINTLIPRTQYYKAVFMARYPPVYGVYLCHHYPHPWHLPSSCSSSSWSRDRSFPWPGDHSVSRLTHSHSVFLFLMSSCLRVTKHQWLLTPLSIVSQSENNGNDISSFLSGSNCNDQLLVACAPYAPPCPQNCRVMQWKMQCMRTENTRLIS